MTLSVPQIPRSVHFDTWAYCNAKCLFCWYPRMKRKAGQMPFDMLAAICEEIKHWPCTLEEIVPVHYGEFFSNPEWERVIETIESRLPKTILVIPTNGAFLLNGTMERIYEHPTVKIINFSVNANDPRIYAALMGLDPENLANVERVIDDIHDKRPDIRVVVSMCHSTKYQPVAEQREFTERWYRKAEVAVFPPLSNYQPENVAIPIIRPCRSIYQDISILWTGDIVPCCWDAEGDYIIGNVANMTVYDAWYSDKLNALREAHLQGRRQDIPLCKYCTNV